MQLAQGQQQYWNRLPGGNLINTTEWLGADFGSSIPLRIQTRANQPIDFSTANLLRVRLNGNVTGPIGSFAAQAKNGALGLSPNNTLWTNGPGPFSRLHLHDGTTSVWSSSYRPWMDNGITFTTNSDLLYIGHKVEPGSDQSSAVIRKQRLRRPRPMAVAYSAVGRGGILTRAVEVE